MKSIITSQLKTFVVTLSFMVFISSFAHGQPAYTIGGIKSGKTYTMTVIDRSVTPGKYPPSIPIFKLHQKIKIKIGAKGQLKIPANSISIPFTTGNVWQNHYSKHIFVGSLLHARQVAEMTKDPTGTKPFTILLDFYDYTNGIRNRQYFLQLK